MGFKQKYGNKIQVYFHPGEGLLAEYREGLVKKNDSMQFMRDLHKENLKEVHQNHEVFEKAYVSLAITFLLGNSILYANDICSNVFEDVNSELVFRVYFGTTYQNLQKTNSQSKQIPIGEELVQTIMDTLQLFFRDKISLLKWIFFDKNGYKFLPTKNEKQLKNRLIVIRKSCLQVIFNRKNELTQDIKQAKNNFLDRYLKEIIESQNNDITYDEIVDNFLGLFFAGTDTTGNMTGCNSKNPQELFNSFSFEDISELNLLNGILKEFLRLIPPAVEVFPRLAKKNIKIGEFEIKKGDIVSTHFIYNQSNPEVFANPDEFNPQRWINTKEQFNFTPFSMCPRNCKGQHLAVIEGKSMLTYILLNFEILPNYEQEVVKEMKIVYGLKYDNLVFFKRRQQNCINDI
ncbi:hypothetical protein ABPG72_000452 [Tetrahymena utriculariae]